MALLLFGYKIIKLNKYSRVGFPINSLIKITSTLTNKEINYIPVIDGTIKCEKFNHNKYNDYKIDSSIDILNYNLALKKIKLINTDLMNNINNPKIIDILNEIEMIICKISL